MRLQKLAAHFAFKYGEGEKPVLHFEEHQRKIAMVNLKELIEDMYKLVVEGKELRQSVSSMEDPMISYSEDASLGREVCSTVLSSVLWLKNNFDKVKLEELIVPIVNLKNVIEKEALTTGSDKWKLVQAFYHIRRLWEDNFTIDAAYHKGDSLDTNSLVLREGINVPFGKLTNTLAGVHRLANQAVRVFNKLLPQGGLKEFIKLTDPEKEEMGLSLDEETSLADILDQSSVKVNRVVKPLLDHEKNNMLIAFYDKFGLDPTNREKALYEWAKYISIPADQQMRRDFAGESSETLMREIFRAKIQKKENSPVTRAKIEEMSGRINRIKDANREKERLQMEKKVSPVNTPSRPLAPPFRPKQTGLSAEERAEEARERRMLLEENKRLLEEADALQDIKKMEQE